MEGDRGRFRPGWLVEAIEPSRIETRHDLMDLVFSEGGPKAWFVVVRVVLLGGLVRSLAIGYRQ